MARKELSVEAINQRLKAAKTGVSIKQRGDRLALRATLPPRPGSGKDKPHQQYLSLGIYANPAGLQRAEREAQRLGLLLAEGKFDWNLYLNAQPEGETVGYWLEKFKDHCIRSILRTDGLSEDGIDKLWRRRYVNLGLGKLNPNDVLTPELLIQAVLTKKSNSRSRQIACQVMAQFAKFAGLEVDFSPYIGSYSSLKQVKDLPSDQEIEEAVAAFKNPQWQYVAAMMATFGLRDHEVFFTEVLEEDGDWIAKVSDGKTEGRDVFPLPVEWVERWQLWERRLPPLKVRLKEEYGERVARAFKRQGCPFTPYTLRHANAVRRSVTVGLPIKVAADDMGHSPEVHLKVYSRHLSKAQRREAHRRSRNKN